jgi:2-isopropylmalate synthase
MRTRSDHFGLRTGIDTRRIYPTSRLVATLTGIHVQRNKAIVGENAFAHEAGIHQHGVLAERSTYEIMRPEDVGVPESRLVIGKHSGRHGIEARLRAMGYSIAPAELERVTERVKAIADKKKVVYDADIEAVLRDVVDTVPQTFTLERFHVTSGNSITPTATVALRRGKELLQDAACGDGPVNAVYNAITRLTGLRGVLREYHIDSVAGGSEAMGEVSVLVDFGGREIGGRGTSTDVIEASALAYLAAVNRAAANRAAASGRPAAPGARAASRRRKGR